MTKETKHQYRLPREIVEFPSLEIFWNRVVQRPEPRDLTVKLAWPSFSLE